MKNRFFIVNQCDRPAQWLIAEMRNGKLFYLAASLKRFGGMDADRATPVEDFGITLHIDGGNLNGTKDRESIATYSDGRRREWQGAGVFSVPYLPILTN